MPCLESGHSDVGLAGVCFLLNGRKQILHTSEPDTPSSKAKLDKARKPRSGKAQSAKRPECELSWRTSVKEHWSSKEG